MDAPILPLFFKKLDMFQKLKMLESQGKDNIWLMQKYLLKWAVSPDHQHIGNVVVTGTLKDGLLKELTQAGLLPNPTYEGYISNITLVGNALAVNGFATIENDWGSLKFTPDGYLAGTILIETNFLKKPSMYELWRRGLMALVVLGILTLLVSCFAGIVGIINDFHDMTKSSEPPQVRVINNIPTSTMKIVSPTVESSPTTTSSKSAEKTKL